MAASQEDVCSHVRVVVRVRPENEKEKQGNFSRVVQVVDNHILVFDPKVEEVGFFHGRSAANRDITKRKNKDLKFVFDCVFDDSSTQLEVFEQTTKIVLEGVLNGYNCTVLAYGATGAGKTHTMLGSPGEPGVMYLTMMELYNRIESVKDEKVCNVAISYLEVYNEQIRDLLSNSGALAVREDAQKGVVVQGLTLHQPKSAEEILQMLDYGNKNRTQHPTDMNASSSRSHAVFQIYLRQQDKTASINQNVRIAKMCLIDLAGSERASATNAKGERLREGTNINRSLLALGNVINALADPKVKSNVVSLDSHISQYVKICEQQKKEIAALKEKLKAYEDQKAIAPGKPKQNVLLPPCQNQAEIKRFQEILRCLFTNREEIRAEYLNLEMRFKENELKTYYQKQCFEQIQMLCSQEKAVKASCKRDHRVEVLKNQNVLLQKKKEDELKRLEENTTWLHRLESEMKLLNNDGKMPEELGKDLQCHHLTLEVTDLKTQIKHMTRLVALQERENRYNEKLVNALLPSLRRQYLLLSQVGLADTCVEADFKKIEQLVQREKAVVWADQAESDEANKCDDSEIAAVVTFPHLKYSQTTPCKEEKCAQLIQSAEKMAQKENPLAIVRHFTGAQNSQTEEFKENVPQKAINVVPPRKRTRRKLMDSPMSTESHQQNDSISDELSPIVYTPETSNNTVTLLKQVAKIPCVVGKRENNPGLPDYAGHAGFSFPMTSESKDTDMNSTVILSHGDGDKSSENTADAKSGTTSMLQRLGLSSLLSKPSSKPLSEKPSYMAMTSAAERKRKLLSLAGNSAVKEDSVALPTAKRVRQDISLDCKALRVQRVAAGTTRNKDNCARRRLPKSVSESALGVKGKPFSFQASAQLLFQGGKKRTAPKDS
uniref:Kinesin-like protein n=1 Tax=Xenopus tropicalis TaxID=8364 RepID=A0A6I8RUF8_XENTR